MKRCVVAVLLFAWAALPVRAHFIWIVPDKQAGTVQVVFSDIPAPDSPKLLGKIAHTQLFLQQANGKTVPLKWTLGKEAYQVVVSDAASAIVGAICRYGVLEKGKAEPFLLMYYAKACLPELAKGDRGRPLSTRCEHLPFEILQPEGKDPRRLQVLWRGQPLAGTEVVIVPPGDEDVAERKTDAKGCFDLGEVKPGIYGVRARYVEAKEGEHEGKRYKEVRHYTTLVFQVEETKRQGLSQPSAKVAVALKEDPVASKLLAEARAARAHWENFPGFSADLEVNLDGKVSRGKVLVTSNGKVTVENSDKAAQEWAKRILSSIVAHRLSDSAERDSACAFADSETDHPLGRAIQVLDDEFHSSYRIRDRQIVVVNRHMKNQRFTITVLENRTNKEGKFLPISYAVNYWDTKTGELTKSVVNHQKWTRVGTFDLPVRALVLTSNSQGADSRSAQAANSLTLSSHKLLENQTAK
jgi:uncharacterized protein DUF3386/uncharacterized protein DUF4198